MLLNSLTFLANPIISPIKKIRHLNTKEAYGMKGYQLFRKDGLGRQGGGIALYAREQLECMELCTGMRKSESEFRDWSISHMRPG